MYNNNSICILYSAVDCKLDIPPDEKCYWSYIGCPTPPLGIKCFF